MIQYGSSFGPQQCYIALNILKNVCITFENKMFSSKQTAMIKRWFKENVHKIFEFANKILSQGGSLPHEVVLECLSSTKHWCTYSRRSFMINEIFVSTVLNLLNDSSITIYKKIVNILKKMLTTSDHVKLICNMSFEKVI